MNPNLNPLEEIVRFLRSKDVLPRLILVNVLVWLAISAMRVFSFLLNVPDATLTNYIVDYFALPAKPESLLVRPWTLLTYMFLHIDFFHILFNMLWLYWFGRIFLEYLDQRKLVAVYLMGGASGAIVYILSFNVFPAFSGVCRPV